MTLQDIEHSNKVMLTPAEVAGVVGCDPQYIRMQARENPQLLGFHVVVTGNRTKIPREALVNANSKVAPQIVDAACNPILDKSEVYSGCYARVSLNFYAFSSNGNRGIACGLGNIQKLRDGEPLGGRTSAAMDFGSESEDDFLS